MLPSRSLFSTCSFVQSASLVCCILSQWLIGGTPVCCDSAQCVRKLVVHYNILKGCSQKLPRSFLYGRDCGNPSGLHSGRGWTFSVCSLWMHVSDMEMKADSKASKHAYSVRLCVDGSVNEWRNTHTYTHPHHLYVLAPDGGALMGRRSWLWPSLFCKLR